MQVVPVQAIGNQTVYAQLNGQSVQLNIRQQSFGLFMDVLIQGNSEPIVAGVLCENLNRIVRDLYLGFEGDFAWLDNEGTTNPAYTGLGGRYSLIYLAPSDLPVGIG